MTKREIDPASLRGRLCVKFASMILTARNEAELMAREAKKQGLTPDHLLAAVLTEAALEVFEGTA